MSQVMLEESQLKEALKQAMVELLQERKDLFYDLVEEIVEDMGLLRAIKEGETTEAAGREEVYRGLEKLP